MRRQEQTVNTAATTPWTPMVWLVLWVSIMVGYLKGYASGAGILANAKFRLQWFPKSRQPSAFPYDSGDLGDALCNMTVGADSHFMAVKYIVACAMSLPAGWVVRSQGRRPSILIGCAAYCAAHLLQGAAVNMNMLIAGQVFHGIAATFLYQAPCIEIVEVAPHQWRGAFVGSDALGRSVGLWTRSLMHAGLGSSSNGPAWGWRLSTLFPLWPALVVMMLVPLIPETPNSLIQRGRLDEGRAALQEIRGPAYNVDNEFAGILKAAGISHTTKRPPNQVLMLLKRQQLPPLLLMLLVTVLRECMGADTMRLFFRPFWEAVHWTRSTRGFQLEQVESAFYLLAVVASIFTIDRWGRRPVMTVSTAGSGLGFLATVISMTVETRDRHILTHFPLQVSTFVSMVVAYTACVFGFAGNYWLLMAELFPLATRPLATSVLTGFVMLMYSLTSLVAMQLVCTVQLGLLLFYTVGNALLLLVVLFLLPETKCVALEDIHLKFQQHWLWRHFQQQRQQGRAGHGNASAAHGSVRRPRPPAGVLQGAHGAAATAAAQFLQQQQLDDGYGALPDGGSIMAQQQPVIDDDDSGLEAPSPAAARELSMQPAGTMSLDLEAFMYGQH